MPRAHFVVLTRNANGRPAPGSLAARGRNLGMDRFPPVIRPLADPARTDSAGTLTPARRSVNASRSRHSDAIGGMTAPNHRSAARGFATGAPQYMSRPNQYAARVPRTTISRNIGFSL